MWPGIVVKARHKNLNLEDYDMAKRQIMTDKTDIKCVFLSG